MKYYLLCILLCSTLTSVGQDDLLSELEIESEEQKSFRPAFKAMKICNLQSTKVAGKGDLFMNISHRFGSIQNGFDTFFGLDDANTKIQMVYGLFDGVEVGLARESLGKAYSGSLKLKIMEQSGTVPINITAYLTSIYNTSLNVNRYPELKTPDRFSYAFQLLLSRSISRKISVEIAPGLVRHNLVFDSSQRHDQFVMGAGARFKMTKRTSLNADYSYNFNRSDSSPYQDQLSVGVDLETGGHVFQLIFTNAQSTSEPIYLTRAEGNWETGDIFFGFNIVRVF